MKKFIICALIFLNWFIPVFFFPVINIDGHYYSQRAIQKLIAQRKKYYDSNTATLSDKLKINIENQYSTYINSIKKLSIIEDIDGSLSQIIKENIIEIDFSENKFIENFENLLQYKENHFVLPLQTRDIKDKDTILKEIFPNIYKNYSINNSVYFSIALDLIKEKIITFKNEFPPIALKFIEDTIDRKYNQYLNYFKSRTEIDINDDNFLQDAIFSLRKQGETLWFFEDLIAECELTGILNDNIFTIEPFDISEETKPILLPVCIVDDTVYDAFALKTVYYKTNSLRYDCKKIKEENILKIINNQEEIINRNLSSYIDIDYGVDMYILPALLSYYWKQINVSANLFSSELRQCIYEVEEPEKYPIENFSDIDISPFSFDAVKINNKLYDATALSCLYNVIKSFRAKWESFLNSENFNLISKIKNYFYKDISFIIDYISEVSNISGDFFMYLYDNCSIMPQDFAVTIIDSDIKEINIEQFLLNVIEIDEGNYYAYVINTLQQLMQNSMNSILIDFKNDLSAIIDTKILNFDQTYKFRNNYPRHDYLFFIMLNDIKSCLLKYNDKTKKQALIFIEWLKIFQISPYLTVKTENIINGNDFIAPCKAVPDYIRSLLTAKNSSKVYLRSDFNKFDYVFDYMANNTDNLIELISTQVTDDFESLEIRQGDDIIYDFSNIHGRIIASRIKTNQGNTIIYNYIPKIKGRWNGIPGDSTFFPDLDYIPKRGIQKREIQLQLSYQFPKTWKEIIEQNLEQVQNIPELTPEESKTLSDNYMKFSSGESGFTFKQGKPDFSSFSYNTIDIKSFGYNKISIGRQILNTPLGQRKSVMELGDELLAEKWNLSTIDVANFRIKWSLMWHERIDMHSIDLIPNNIHNLVIHRHVMSIIE